MKKLIFVLTCAFLTSCAPNTEKVVVKGEKGDSGTNGQSCSVSRNDFLKQTTISCPDSIAIVYDGKDADESRLDSLESAMTAVETAISALQAAVTQLQAVNPTVTNNYSVTINIPFTFGNINVTYVTNNVNNVDLTPLNNKISSLEALLESLTTRVESLESERVEFVKLCPNSTEYGMKQGSKLYAVGFNYTVGGGLMLLSSGSQYYTTTTPSNACKFKVENDGTTSGHSYGHNITSLFGSTPTVPVLPPSTITGSCELKNTNNYTGQKDYNFTLTDSTGLVGDYRLELNTENASVDRVGTTNSGDFTKVNNTNFVFTPINNSTSFTVTLFKDHGGGNLLVQTLKVVKISDPTKFINCTVKNATN